MTSVPPSDLSARLAQLSPERRALLERALRKLTPAQPVGIARRGNDGPAPLSYAQERLWFMEQAMSGGSAAYTISLLLDLRGPLDVDLLRRSLAGVAERHETLRSRIGTTDDGVPRLWIVDDPEVPFSRVDVSGAADPHAELADAVETASARPFVLADEPLLRALLVTVADEEHALLVSVHHAVIDGWSTTLFVKDLTALLSRA